MLLEGKTLINADQSRKTSTKHEGKKVTIYLSGEFMGNIHTIRARLHESGTAKFAQYDGAPFLRFTPKSKRTGRVWHGTQKPGFGLVVEGWDAPESASIYTDPVPSETPGVSVSRGRYASFDDGWVNDFNATINPLIEAGTLKVVADFRGVNPYTGEKEGEVS